MTTYRAAAALATLAICLLAIIAGGLLLGRPEAWAVAPMVAPFGGFIGWTLVRRK